MTLPLTKPAVSLPIDHSIGAEAGSALFGGNILAPRATMTGPGSYDEAITDLGTTGLRYPGGSLTEDFFDIENPDQRMVTHGDTGVDSKFIPLSEFMSYAGANGHEVTIVLPTRYNLTDAGDGNGNRLPDLDETALRGFIHDLASGTYGDAPIAGIEIGNEYWGSGRMNAVEYGRLASETAVIIKQELAAVSEQYGIDTSGIKVLVQMGANYSYSNLCDSYEGWHATDVIDDLLGKYPDCGVSDANIRGNGEVNWTEVANHLVISGFDSPEKMEAVDGVIAHVYTFGSEQSAQSNHAIDTINNIWLDHEGFENLEIHVTEWNMKSTDALDRHEDYGLFQAHEMLNIVEIFMETGVDQAHVWPLIQNTSNPLAVGFDYSQPTVPGRMFSMMSEHLPGKTALDFSPGLNRGTEFEGDTVDIHGFAGQGDLLFYIASETDTPQMTDLDLSNLITGFETMEITVLGVEDGQNPGSTRSAADVEDLNPDELYREGVLSVDLDAREIMQVVIRGIEPTPSFAHTMEAIDGPPDVFMQDVEDSETDWADETAMMRIAGDALPQPIATAAFDAPDATGLAMEFEIEQPDDTADVEDQSEGSSSDFGGLLFALGLLPLLAAFGV